MQPAVKACYSVFWKHRPSSTHTQQACRAASRVLPLAPLELSAAKLSLAPPSPAREFQEVLSPSDQRPCSRTNSLPNTTLPAHTAEHAAPLTHDLSHKNHRCSTNRAAHTVTLGPHIRSFRKAESGQTCETPAVLPGLSDGEYANRDDQRDRTGSLVTSESRTLAGWLSFQTTSSASPAWRVPF